MAGRVIDAPQVVSNPNAGGFVVRPDRWFLWRWLCHFIERVSANAYDLRFRAAANDRESWTRSTVRADAFLQWHACGLIATEFGGQA
jgi:hypothetical protein